MAQQQTILIVDDDSELRGALAEQLQIHEEFNTSEAGSGSDGVERAREIKPDLILFEHPTHLANITFD